MFQSFEKNQPVVDYSAKSIAGGLAPPLAGKLIFLSSLTVIANWSGVIWKRRWFPGSFYKLYGLNYPFP